MLSSPSCVRTFVLRSYTHSMTYRWFCWGTAYLKEKNISYQYHQQIQYCPSPLPAGDLEPAGCITNVTNKRPSSHGLFPHLSSENNYCINYWTKNYNCICPGGVRVSVNHRCIFCVLGLLTRPGCILLRQTPAPPQSLQVLKGFEFDKILQYKIGSCLISYFFFTPFPWCLLIIKINQIRSRRKEEETQCVHESKQWEACLEMASHGTFPLSTPTLLDATLFNATLCYATLVLISNVKICYLVFWCL